jgi:thiol-disulfide isomerase/thioredoxin
VTTPLIAGVIALLVIVTRDGGTADTPRATLVDTPDGVTSDVGVRTGELGRDFSARSPDGTLVRLSELRGRPTIINFWATWCTSCLAELPDFKALQREVGAENLNVLAVNAGEGAGDAREFLEELRADAFYVGMDPTLVVADAYGVAGLPTSVFLDADGVIRGVYAGHLRGKDMRAYLDAARSGDDALEPEPQIRLVTTVARDHILEVDNLSDGRVDFRAKSLRCDDSYCATDAITKALNVPGIVFAELRSGDDPPRLKVGYDGTITLHEVTSLVAEVLSELADPLYERPLEIVKK